MGSEAHLLDNTRECNERPGVYQGNCIVGHTDRDLTGMTGGNKHRQRWEPQKNRLLFQLAIKVSQFFAVSLFCSRPALTEFIKM